MAKRRIKALVIDNDASFVHRLRKMLEDIRDVDFDLGWAKRLSTGLKRVGEESYDIVLIDLDLPDAGGVNIIDALYQTTPEIPVIVTADRADSELGVDAAYKSLMGHLYKDELFANEFSLKMISAIEKKQIDTALDEKRALAEKVLRSKEEILSTIIDNVPIMMLVVDKKRRVRKVNRAIEVFTGKSEDEVMDVRGGEALRCLYSLDSSKGCGFGKYCRDCKVRNTILKTFETEENYYSVEAELPFIVGDYKTFISFLFSSTLIEIEGEKLVLVSIVDITQQKKAFGVLERQRYLTEALNATDSLEDAMAVCIETAVSGTGMDAGAIYLIDERTGAVSLKHAVGIPDDVVKAVSNYEADSPALILMKSDKPVYTPFSSITGEIDRKLLEEGFKAIAVVPVRFDNKVIAYLNVASRVVEEVPRWARNVLESIAGQAGYVISRLKSANALSESEERFRALTENTSDIIAIIGRNGVYKYIGPSIAQYGYSIDDFIGKNAFKFIHRDDRKSVKKTIKESLANPGKAVQIPSLRLLYRDGSWAYSEGIIINLLGTPSVDGIVFNGRDVTEKVLSAKSLEDSESKNRALSECTYEAIFFSDKGYCIEANQAAVDMFGYSYSELIGIFGTDVIAEESKDLVKKNMLAGYEKPYEAVAQRKDGTKFIAEFEARMYNYRGREVRVTAVRDISERKKAEEALRFTQFSVDRAAEAAFWMGHDARFIYVNEAACRALGYTRDELLSMTVHDIDPDFPREVWPGHWRDVKEKGSFTIESHHRTKEGRVFPVEISVNYLEFEGKEYNCAFARDITDRKEALKALRESEERYRTLQMNIPVGIYRTTPEGEILAANPALAAMFGYEHTEDIIGIDTKTLYANPERRNIFVNNMEEDGYVADFEAEFIRRDGSAFWGSLTARAVLDSDGEHRQNDGIIENIDERKKAEERIRASLSEKEVMLREIHHRVKNNLQVISSLLSLQASYVNDEGLLTIFSDSQNRIRSMALIHEKLYQSEDLARVDFSDYIDDLTRTLLFSYRVEPDRIGLSTDISDVRLNIETSIPLALIINELVSNSIKHAFADGRAGEITVKLFENNDHKYELIVSDNGIGLPDGLDITATEKLGLNLVNILVRQLNGTIETGRGDGAEFSVKFDALS